MENIKLKLFYYIDPSGYERVQRSIMEIHVRKRFKAKRLIAGNMLEEQWDSWDNPLGTVKWHPYPIICARRQTCPVPLFTTHLEPLMKVVRCRFLINLTLKGAVKT